MKRLLIAICILFSTFALFSQETPDTDFQNLKSPFAFVRNLIKPDFVISFNEGVSYAQITRIEILENRSNFVRENFLIGAFVNMKTDNLSLIDFVVQLGAYYPYYQAFNGMRQYPKNVVSYAVDGYLGAVYSFDFLRYILFDVSLGMHYMYQLTDEYHMSYLGLGTLNTIELPITERWSIINNYFFSYDNANLGSNKKVQKFDASYQYHIDLGVRYTRKAVNQYYYIDVEQIKENHKAKKELKNSLKN